MRIDRVTARAPIAVACAAGLLLAAGAANAAEYGPVAQRAIDGAKAYVKAKGLKNPTLDILLNSLYRNSFPDFAKEWQGLTGVAIKAEPPRLYRHPEQGDGRGGGQDRRLRHV